MPKARSSGSSGPSQASRPPLTPEARENQLISLAIDLVEQRLRDGTASSQETTHFLKLASSKGRLENKLLEAQAQKRSDELMDKALKAFRSYAGAGDYEDDEDY